MATDAAIGWDTHPWVAQAQAGPRFGVAAGAWSEARGLIAYVQALEDLGFDSYWGIDHPGLFGADCWTALAALAVTTRRIRLGSLVSCVYYREPALLARTAADVDRLSDGRLVLGLGIGHREDEFRQLGLPFLSARQRQEGLEETVAIVQGLWGPEPFSFAGEQFGVSGATVRPGPVQRPRVPLLIAGGGARGTLRQVARYADASNFGESPGTGRCGTIEDVARRFDALRSPLRGDSVDPIIRSSEHTAHSPYPGRDAARLQAKVDAIPGPIWARWGASSFVGTPSEAITYYGRSLRRGCSTSSRSSTALISETPQLLAEQVVPNLRAG